MLQMGRRRWDSVGNAGLPEQVLWKVAAVSPAAWGTEP